MRVPFEINRQRGNRVAARHRGGLSFGHFSLATQRKVTRHEVQDAQMSRVHGRIGATRRKRILNKNIAL